MFTTTRAAFAPPGPVPAVPRLHSSYATLRLPRLHRPGALVPLTPGLLRAECSFLSAHAHTRFGRAGVGEWYPGPRCHRCPLAERQGPPRCLGRPLRACHGQRLRRVRCPLALSGNTAVAFRKIIALGNSEFTHFVAALSWPTRSRAYASTFALPLSCKARYRPGGAPPSSGGFRTRWTSL